VGGGKAHGPRNDKDYSQKVNKKMKRVALFAALSRKVKDGELKVFETLAIDAPKTKALADALKGAITLPKGGKRWDVLLIADGANKNLFRAASNLVKTKVLAADSLNVFDILNHKNLFLDKEVVEKIVAHYKV
jgi:large subunit ribosomal protein L4